MSDENTIQEAAKAQGQEAQKVDWRSGLSEDTRGNESIKNFGDVDALAKAFIETKRMQGNSVHLLGEDASAEQRANQMMELASKIGTAVPGEDAYKIMQDKLPEMFNNEMANAIVAANRPEEYQKYTTPEGIEDVGDQWMKIAFDSNLTDAQNSAMLKNLNEQTVAANTEFQVQHDAALKKLHEDFGSAYDDRRSAAHKAAKMMADKTGVTAFADAFAEGAETSDTFRLFAGIAAALGAEGNSTARDNTMDVHTNTPAEASKAIAEINNNNKHDYWTEPAGTSYRKVLDDKMVRLMGESRSH